MLAGFTHLCGSRSFVPSYPGAQRCCGLTSLLRSAAGIQKLLAGVPSAVFEASIPGVKSFTVGSRVACIGVKFLEYSLAGVVCGFIGQGMANSLMLLK